LVHRGGQDVVSTRIRLGEIRDTAISAEIQAQLPPSVSVKEVWRRVVPDTPMAELEGWVTTVPIYKTWEQCFAAFAVETGVVVFMVMVDTIFDAGTSTNGILHIKLVDSSSPLSPVPYKTILRAIINTLLTSQIQELRLWVLPPYITNDVIEHYLFPKSGEKTRNTSTKLKEWYDLVLKPLVEKGALGKKTCIVDSIKKWPITSLDGIRVVRDDGMFKYIVNENRKGRSAMTKPSELSTTLVSWVNLSKKTPLLVTEEAFGSPYFASGYAVHNFYRDMQVPGYLNKLLAEQSSRMIVEEIIKAQ
jgi:hypothetical protein